MTGGRLVANTREHAIHLRDEAQSLLEHNEGGSKQNVRWQVIEPAQPERRSLNDERLPITTGKGHGVAGRGSTLFDAREFFGTQLGL